MSAVANAEQRPQIDVDTLVVKGVQVDGGPSLKRFQARAMGRVNRILKRSSHITVVLKEGTGEMISEIRQGGMDWARKFTPSVSVWGATANGIPCGSPGRISRPWCWKTAGFGTSSR